MSKRTRALKEEIYDLYPKLTPASAAALDAMISYLKLKNIGACQRLSVQRDIAQMLLEAEAQGRAIEEVLGTDHRAFCDEIITALPQPTLRERRLRMGRWCWRAGFGLGVGLSGACNRHLFDLFVGSRHVGSCHRILRCDDKRAVYTAASVLADGFDLGLCADLCDT